MTLHVVQTLTEERAIIASNAPYLYGTTRMILRNHAVAGRSLVRVTFRIGEEDAPPIEEKVFVNTEKLWEILAGVLIGKAPRGDCLVRITLEELGELPCSEEN